MTSNAEKKSLDLVFLDVETTGLDHAVHEILEVAAIRVTADLDHVLATYSTKVTPARLHTASPEALAVNGYAPETWTDSIPLVDALIALWPLLEGAVPAGHNVGFDLGFLEAAAREMGQWKLPTDYHRLDTASLGWLLVTAGDSTSWSLGAVCDALGVKRDREHTALDDALAALQVARCVRERWLNPVMVLDASGASSFYDEGFAPVEGPGTPLVGRNPAFARVLPLPRKFGGDA